MINCPPGRRAAPDADGSICSLLLKYTPNSLFLSLRDCQLSLGDFEAIGRKSLYYVYVVSVPKKIVSRHAA